MKEIFISHIGLLFFVGVFNIMMYAIYLKNTWLAIVALLVGLLGSLMTAFRADPYMRRTYGVDRMFSHTYFTLSAIPVPVIGISVFYISSLIFNPAFYIPDILSILSIVAFPCALLMYLIMMCADFIIAYRQQFQDDV